MRILVTGGAGFIGSHVCEVLSGRGHSVVAFDNFDSGHRSNLDHLPDVELIEGDIRDPGVLRLAFSGVDSVVHLAAEPSVPKSVEHPLATHQANYVGTLNVLEAMRTEGISRIVYASSAAVYSPDSEAPHREDELPDPTSPYGVDKLAGEYLLKSYGRMYGIRPTALRFFNIYGERQDPKSAYSGVISIFMDRAIASQAVTIHGLGDQLRDFVYVRDLAAIVANLAEAEGSDHVVMNVATGKSTTLIELLDVIEAVVDATVERSFTEPRVGDIRISRADNSLILPCVGSSWTSLHDGLSALARYGK